MYPLHDTRSHLGGALAPRHSAVFSRAFAAMKTYGFACRVLYPALCLFPSSHSKRLDRSRSQTGASSFVRAFFERATARLECGTWSTQYLVDGQSLKCGVLCVFRFFSAFKKISSWSAFSGSHSAISLSAFS